MRLSHNLASLNIYYEYTKNLNDESTALNRISSGKKITSAQDDPNDIAKSERMNMQIRGLQAGAQNSQDGISMLQTADGAIHTIVDNLQRMRQLVVASGSGSITDSDKKDMQLEIEQIKQEIDNTANNTAFNGVKLLNAASAAPPAPYDNMNPTSTVTATIGPNPSDSIVIPKFNITTGMQDSAGNTLGSVDVTVPNSINANLDVIDSALSSVLHAGSVYGGIEKRFTDSYNNTNAISDKTQEASSSLSDADIANEMLEYSKSGILVSTGLALMAQSNKFPQDILNILSQIKSR